MRTPASPRYKLHLDLHHSTRLITAFINEHDWTIDRTIQNSDYQQFLVRPSQRNARPFSPAHADWRLYADGSHTQIECRHFLSPRLHVILPILLLVVYQLLNAAIERATNTTFEPLLVLLIVTVLATWAMDKEARKIDKDLRIFVSNTTGKELTTVQYGLTTASPTAYLLYLFAAAAILCLQIANDTTVLHVFGLNLVALLLLAIVILTSMLLSAYALRHYQPSMPHLCAGFALITYGAWPHIDALLPKYRDNYVLATTLFYVLTTAGTLYLLAITAAQTRITATTTNTPSAEPTHHRTIPAAIVLGTWILGIITQYEGITWTIDIITRRNTPTATIPSLCWPIPIITAFAILLTQRTTRTAQLRRAAQETPPELTQQAATLARAMQLDPPRVALTNDTTTHAERHLLLGPLLVVSTNDLALLTTAERDALLLHELYHLKHHAGLTAALDALSTITFCAHGLLSTLPDAPSLELDADQAARQVLQAHGQPGAALVQSMLLKTNAAQLKHGATRPASTPSGLRYLYDLFFGTGVFWHHHPSLTERLAALRSAAA